MDLQDSDKDALGLTRWYIVYRCKPSHGTLKENLEKNVIDYFIPTMMKEEYTDGEIVGHEVPALNNLLFIQTERNVSDVISTTDGLRASYHDIATGMPATVSNDELLRFRRVLEARDLHARFLPDSFRKFADHPRVRVKAGDFAGLEGYVLRIRGDRKVVIGIDDIAIAISGIHHTLLEKI